MLSTPDPAESNLDKLLSWLNTDRNLAGEEYETIRKRLIKIFVVRGSRSAEELTDTVFERVTNKVFEVSETYNGDPALYFYGVAHLVFLESLKRPKFVDLPENSSKMLETSLDDEMETTFDLLEKCLSHLESKDRDLILAYYENEKRTKIEHRRAIAKNLGMSIDTLRTKVCRIRTTLRECVTKSDEEK